VIMKHLVKSIRKVDVTALVAILSLGISIASFLFTVSLSNSSDRQFEALNQGYLDVLPAAVYNFPDGSETNETPPVSVPISSVAIAVRLNNVGHIPIKLKVTKMEIEVGGEKFAMPDQGKYSKVAVVYPGGFIDFTSAPIEFFDRITDQPSPKRYPELQQFIYKCHLIVTYNDMGSDREKKVDRVMEHRFSSNGMVTGFNEINDIVTYEQD
jgi:hypothetical protein